MRPRSVLQAAGGPGRLPDKRWRQELAARAERRRQYHQGPTAQALEVNRSYEQWLETSQTELGAFQKKDVPAFNDLLKNNHLMLAIQP